MRTKNELEEYVEMNGITNSLSLSEEYTIPAIIGHDEATGALIYDYDKLVECFALGFEADATEEDKDKDFDYFVEMAEDWVSYNTVRSLPYKHSDYVAYDKNGKEVKRFESHRKDAKEDAEKAAGEGGRVEFVSYENPILMIPSREYEDYCMPRTYKFDAVVNKDACIKWIKEWFDTEYKGGKAIIGMSGGKDSTIAAALCAEALGKENVIGVAMPDTRQGVNDADKICEYLGIQYMCIPIDGVTSNFNNIWNKIGDEDFKWSKQSEQNIPPRVRMTMLYAVAQTYHGIPINTCNLSEDYIGYATIFGDAAGGMSPIRNMTVTEIIQIGEALGLPKEWIYRTPNDDLPHSCPDEEKFGFSYESLDKYIREHKWDGNKEIREKIDNMHLKNLFKIRVLQIPAYEPKIYEE